MDVAMPAQRASRRLSARDRKSLFKALATGGRRGAVADLLTGRSFSTRRWLLMADRGSWGAIKHGRRDTASRREGHRRAKQSFELIERGWQARERAGMTQTDSASVLTKVTERGQVSIPAAIRRRLRIAPNTLLEWIVEGTTVRVIPIPDDPIAALRGSGKRGAVGRLLKDRGRERKRDG
jgi:AbrB family looped-hinge helix DNA binding protein